MSVSAVKRFVKELVVRSLDEDVTPPGRPPMRPTPLRQEPGPWGGGERPCGHAHPIPPAPLEPRSVNSRSRREEAPELFFPIGFSASQVPAGEEVEIEVRPQTHFTGQQLVIPSDIAKAFDVVDLKVGKNSQALAVGRIPGTVFEPTAASSRIKLGTAMAGMTVTLSVVNITEGPQDFKAALFGAVEDC